MALDLGNQFRRGRTNNLGVALLELGRLDPGTITLPFGRRHRSRKSDYAETHNNLGNALREQKKHKGSHYLL